MSARRLLLVGLVASALVVAGCGGRSQPQRGGEVPADADVVVEVRFLQPAGRGARWGIEPARIEVARGQKVALVVINDQPLPHDVVFGPPYNLRTPVLTRGQRAVLTFVASEGTSVEGIPMWCSVPGYGCFFPLNLI